jgi:hypothetical protein
MQTQFFFVLFAYVLCIIHYPQFIVQIPNNVCNYKSTCWIRQLDFAQETDLHFVILQTTGHSSSKHSSSSHSCYIPWKLYPLSLPHPIYTSRRVEIPPVTSSPFGKKYSPQLLVLKHPQSMKVQTLAAFLDCTVSPLHQTILAPLIGSRFSRHERDSTNSNRD